MQMQRLIEAIRFGFLVLLVPSCGCATTTSKDSLRDSMTLYASFDHGIDADYAAGDKQLYGKIGKGNDQVTAPGLPQSSAVQLAKGQGRYGDAVRFTKKSDTLLFFKNPNN